MSQLRRHWLLDPGVTFLNHGSFGACPRSVLDVQAALREEMETEPLQFLWRGLGPRLDAARAALAEFVRADVEGLVFAGNATGAVNAVLRSLGFSRGDELLTTDHAYNACRNVLDEVARCSGASVVVAAVPFPIASPAQAVDAVLAAVTPRTRLALLDHVTSATALVLPVVEIVHALEGRGVPVLVDGAHAPGMVPLDLRELGASWYTGNLHKWVCAPKGAAFLFARRDRQAGLHPAVINHGYNTRREGRSLFHDEFDWQGTFDPTAWLAVPAALEFCRSLFPGGHAELMRRNRELALTARRLLAARLGVDIPSPEEMTGSMATLPLPAALASVDAAPARFDPLNVRLFERYRIEAHMVRWGCPARRWFRISAHAYNEPDDYMRLAGALLAEALNSGKKPA